jgi:hypothetical protein
VFNLNQNCELIVYLRTNCPDPVQFDKLSVRFNLVHYNSLCVVDATGQNSAANREKLNLAPNKVCQFKFSFLLHKEDLNKELEINSISLELGNKDTRVLIINWKGDCKNGLSSEENTLLLFSRFASISPLAAKSNELEWDTIPILPMTRFIFDLSKFETIQILIFFFKKIAWSLAKLTLKYS